MSLCYCCRNTFQYKISCSWDLLNDQVQKVAVWPKISVSTPTIYQHIEVNTQQCTTRNNCKDKK